MPHSVDLMTPRILVVDDEKQIHASLRLRLAKDYELLCCADARQALEAVAATPFDLCFVDIHMPGMNGLAFIEAAQQADPGLGFVVLSAFDSSENLRRTIPLQVLDFVTKPFPERHEFEARIPDWIDRNRRRRREQKLARDAGTLSQDLDTARQEREVELVASETARDALLQTANLLTTIHAHLVTASSLLAARAKTDPSVTPLFRNLEVARKTADAAMSAAESFFESGYGHRDSSPAVVGAGLQHAAQIATKMCRAEEGNKTIDLAGFDERLSIRGLSGIEFLLMMVPPLAAALQLTTANSTVGIRGEHLPRLDAVLRDSRLKNYLWINRRHALSSQPGVLITVAASAAPFSRTCAEGWLRGDEGPLSAVTPRGLVAGLQKCQGLLGLSVVPLADQFRLVLALPA